MKNILLLLSLALTTACVVLPEEEPLPSYVATSPTRTIAEVQSAFTRNKDRFKDLFLRMGAHSGKLYASITIEPDGTVSGCQAVASDFSPVVTEAALVLIKKMQFGARAVPVYTIPDYPIIYAVGR